MSRARERSDVWTVADNLPQAREDLQRDWSNETRARWVTDTTSPDPRPLRAAAEPESRVLQRAVLDAQRRALESVIPADVRPQLHAVDQQLEQLRRAERDLATGTGVWARTPIGDTAHHLQQLRRGREQAESFAAIPGMSRRMRRHWRHDAARYATAEHATAEHATAEHATEQQLEQLTEPARQQLHERQAELEAQRDGLEHADAGRSEWLHQHPEAARRLDRLGAELRTLDTAQQLENVSKDVAKDLSRGLGADQQQHQRQGKTIERGHGIER